MLIKAQWIALSKEQQGGSTSNGKKGKGQQPGKKELMQINGLGLDVCVQNAKKE